MRPGIYPQIPQISADSFSESALNIFKSAEIGGICG